ncbi:MAG: hypothetical protein ACLFM4_08220 [Phormidium sp.]
MYQKKVFPIFEQPQNVKSQNAQAQTGYFVNEIFWNLLLHPQLEQANSSPPRQQPEGWPLPQTNP